MNDLSQLMKLAQGMGMMGGASAPDGIGPRMSLALFSAIENRDCKCEACENLRSVVAFLRESTRTSTGDPAAASRLVL